MTVQIGTNVRIETKSTLASAITVTAITKASPGVATAASHGLSDGAIGFFTVSDGMVELNTQVVRIDNSDTNTFELEGLDTTNFTTFVSGTFTPITAWSTINTASTYAINNAAPDEIDMTVLLDRARRIRYGMRGVKSGTIGIDHDSSVTALATLEAADVDDIIPFRVTYADGSLRLFGAYCAYGGGFSGGVGQKETGEIPVTVPAKVMNYAS